MKTVRFGKFTYVGDPCNTVRIFNELEVDELAILDITATLDGRPPNLELLADIANECFMPVAYGGGIRAFKDAGAILRLGVEKVIINSEALNVPHLIREISDHHGSQAVIVSIDVKRDVLGHAHVYSRAGTRNTRRDPVAWAQEVQALGAGEILLTAIDREGTWEGFDIDLVKSVTQAVGIPVIAQGGAGKLEHLSDVVRNASASAVALGSMVVFQKKGMGVLVNFPEPSSLERLFGPGRPA